MKPALLACALALTACSSVHVHEVAESFDREYAQVLVRTPTKDDLAAARVENAGEAMTATAALARRYLAENPGDAPGSRHVRALLACAYLMQGRTDDARDAITGVPAFDGEHLTPEARLERAVHRAVAACRAVDARIAFERLLAGDGESGSFIRDYGSLVGLDVPDPEAPAYRVLLVRHVETIDSLRGAPPENPHELARVQLLRTDLRRLVNEQIYNDAAALLSLLPPPHEGPGDSAGEWLSALDAALLIVFSYGYPDLLPRRLNGEQKEWYLEQAESFFDAAKAAARFVTPAERKKIEAEGAPTWGPRRRNAFRRLYQGLDHAQIDVRGWILTR